jgi:glutathione S-transferase
VLTLVHAPQSRSSRIVWLLEEIGQPYAIDYVNIVLADGSGQADPHNPHPDKKVPALIHDGAVITESAAVALYLTDLFPEAKMGPAVGDPARGAHLTWLAYYAGVIEPVVVAAFAGVGDHPAFMRNFRGRKEMDRRISKALDEAPYLLGEQFSAADIFLASLGQFMRRMMPEGAAVDAYLERCGARPALARARQKDAPPS